MKHQFYAALTVVFLIGMLIVVLLLRVFPSVDVRAEFIGRVVDGIEVGYLCQRQGWTEDRCKSDFQGYMEKRKAAR